jgi:hemerythrin superfamily protein
MTIFEALKADHAKAKRTLEDLIELTALGAPPVAAAAPAKKGAPKVTAPRTWKEMLGSLKSALLAHDRAEEATFYEALKDRAHLPEFADSRTEEHHAVEALIEGLEKLNPHHHDWQIQLSLLKTQFEAHIDEEETTIFDAVEGAISEDDSYHMAEAFYALRYATFSSPAAQHAAHTRGARA